MPQRILAFIKYVFIFIRELCLANFTVVKQVLSPELKIRPGFISVPMSVRGDFEVTSYANSMTLTPGTISVHIPDDRHAIVLHAMDIGDDPDAVRRSCTDVLEKNILMWSRDPSNRPPAGGIKGSSVEAAAAAAPTPVPAAPPVPPAPAAPSVAPEASAPADDLNAGDSI